MKGSSVARRRPKAQNKYVLLQRLLKGDILQGSIPMRTRGKLTEATGGQGSWELWLREMEGEGIIAGYVPLLSEKGEGWYTAAKTLWGEDEEE